MIIDNIRVKKTRKSQTLLADLVFKGKVKTVYYKVQGSDLRIVGDATPFVAAFLLEAMKKGVALKIKGRVNRALLRNLPQIMSLIESWKIGLEKVDVIVDQKSRENNKTKRVACFFSLGSDSFHTLLKNEKGKNDITDLIFVHGFDLPVKEKNLSKIIIRNLKSVAKKKDKNLVLVETNLREVTDGIVDWEFTHGAALASVGLVLTENFSRIYIAGSSFGTFNMPWGSHPDLDPLWSTNVTAFEHDSPNVSRLEALKVISGSNDARKHLRVCWKNEEGKYNCGKCEKCVRTMLFLYICGSLDNFKTFEEKLTPRIISKVRISQSNKDYWDLIEDELLKKEPSSEITYAVRGVLEKFVNPGIRGALLKSIKRKTAYFDKHYNNSRFYWYLSKKGLII